MSKRSTRYPAGSKRLRRDKTRNATRGARRAALKQMRPRRRRRSTLGRQVVKFIVEHLTYIPLLTTEQKNFIEQVFSVGDAVYYRPPGSDLRLPGDVVAFAGRDRRSVKITASRGDVKRGTVLTVSTGKLEKRRRR